MKQRAALTWTLYFFLFLSLLSGCGGKKDKGLKTVEGDPEKLYQQGLVQYNKRQYSEALKKFEEVKSNFPDSPPFTVWAEMKIGDCHFHKGGYVEAIAAYEEFKKIHPTHEEMPYVQYQLGMSYYSQMLSADRDQMSTRKALSNFEYLVANYPSSLFSEKAREKIEICKKRLADHEFVIGEFYYKQKNYLAAAIRLKEALEKYPRIPGRDKPLMLLGKSCLEIGEREKAKEAFTQIVEEYPRSPYHREAKAMLDREVSGKKSPAPRKQAKKQVPLEPSEVTPETVAVAKFDEERRKPVGFHEETGKPASPKAEQGPLPLPRASVQEEKAQPVPAPKVMPAPEPEKEASAAQATAPEKTVPVSAPSVQEEKAQPVPPPPPLVQPSVEVNREDEKRTAALPSTSKEKGRPVKGAQRAPEELKWVDRGAPIDIISDKVETFTKENLILFKGNVTARQRDMVIYADAVEATVMADGKGIEKVVADGNVKVQQGVRVASCGKAIFFNSDQKVLLTGDPKVWEGGNLVSGEEIVVDLEQNKVEVKGGPGGRGKVKIESVREIEKPK